MENLTMEELEANLALIGQSPRDFGRLDLIVRRPAVDQREVLAEGTLDLRLGLAGDGWSARKGLKMDGGLPNPDRQLTLMNSRVIALLAQTKERWPLAGDQLFVDLDLSAANLPPGTHLKIGSAVIEVTAKPHMGCAKFEERFGRAAFLFVNGPSHKDLHLRGVNARVVEPGLIHTGDSVVVIRATTG
jgi:MOSC domain-containing protein YiiM